MVGYFGNQKFKYNLITQGLENLSYKIVINNSKYLLRIYNKRQFDEHERKRESLEDEINFIKLLYANELPVPKVISNKENRELGQIDLNHEKHFFVLFEYINGKQIKRFNLEKIKNVAKIQAQMHQITANYKIQSKREIDGYLNHYNWYKYILKGFSPKKNVEIFKDYINLAETIYNQLRSSKVETIKKQLIHADLHNENMKFYGEQISGIFDFDDYRISIRSEDIGVFLSVILKSGKVAELEKKVAGYFESYKEILSISDFEKELALYFAIEKRLIYKLSELKDSILQSNVDTKEYSRVLKQMKRILKLAKS